MGLRRDKNMGLTISPKTSGGLSSSPPPGTSGSIPNQNPQPQPTPPSQSNDGSTSNPLAGSSGGSSGSNTGGVTGGSAGTTPSKDSVNQAKQSVDQVKKVSLDEVKRRLELNSLQLHNNFLHSGEAITQATQPSWYGSANLASKHHTPRIQKDENTDVLDLFRVKRRVRKSVHMTFADLGDVLFEPFGFTVRRFSRVKHGDVFDVFNFELGEDMVMLGMFGEEEPPRAKRRNKGMMRFL